jgi:(p)ppGpp synthase/HD superfamily hydrolase
MGAGCIFIGQAYDILTRASISVEKLEIQAERARAELHIVSNISDSRALGQVISELRALQGVQVVRASLETHASTSGGTGDSRLKES